MAAFGWGCDILTAPLVSWAAAAIGCTKTNPKGWLWIPAIPETPDAPELLSQQEFIKRGLASREDAKRIGEYYSVDDVLEELDDLLREAEKLRCQGIKSATRSHRATVG